MYCERELLICLEKGMIIHDGIVLLHSLRSVYEKTLSATVTIGFTS